MERLHPGEFSSKDGRLLQSAEPTAEQLNILKQLGILPPAQLQKIDPPPPRSIGKPQKSDGSGHPDIVAVSSRGVTVTVEGGIK